MFHTLEIENFRGIEKLKLHPLGRINLLVGANNCGKTTVLEAVRLLLEHPANSLQQVLYRRGEITRDRREKQVLLIQHLFRGHTLGLGVKFSIAGTDEWGQVRSTFSIGDTDAHPRLFDFKSPILLIERSGRNSYSTAFPLEAVSELFVYR